MKIHYFGTAAAEGVPAIFCRCDVCRYAREHGDREIRTRAQAMIDGKIMIDFGPDSLFHALRDGVDLTDLRYLLITHAHGDHIQRDDLCNRQKNFAHLSENDPPLTVFCSAEVRDLLRPAAENDLTGDGRVVFQTVSPFVPFCIEDYRITPLPARHGTEMPLIYLIEHEKKTFLYAHDTDVFFDEVWDYLTANAVRFDAVSLDCTEGIKHINYRGHMNFERDFEVRDRMLASGLADGNTVFVANHFSHNGRATYAEAIKPENAQGMLVSYDGMDLAI